MPSNKFQLTLGAQAIEIQPEPIANFAKELIPNAKITGVVPEFWQKPLTAEPEQWMYRYPTMTILVIQLNDGHFERMELQDITNQATWSTGTLVALQTAVAAINAWLVP